MAGKYSNKYRKSHFHAVLFCTFIYIGVNIFAALVTENVLRGILGWLYAILSASLIFCLWHIKKIENYQLFKPSSILLHYLGPLITLGALAFSYNSVIQTRWLSYFHTWRDIDELFFWMTTSFFILFLCSVFCNHKKIENKLSRVIIQDTNAKICSIILFSILCFYAYFFDIENTFLDKELFPTVIALAIILLSQNSKPKTFWGIVLICILLIASFSSHNKRVAIFLLLPAIFVYLNGPKRYFTLNTKVIIVSSAATIGIVYLILAMSIVRGYGSYDVEHIADAILLVPGYIASDEAVGSIANNFEASYSFYVSHDALYKSTISQETELNYGSTYLKAFFVGIPETFLGYKPESIITSYTTFSEPALRDIGGSLPPTAIGEAFWNFGISGPFALFGVFWMLDKIYILLYARYRSTIFHSLILLLFIEINMIFIRGSGLDILVVYLIISLPYVLSIILLMKVLRIKTTYITA